MRRVVTWCLDHWGFTAFAIGCFIQFTPIFKANPLTALLSRIGRIITADVMREINGIKETISKQQIAIDENEKDRIRFEVLDFANSCRNGRRHTKDEFDHILVLNKKYEGLLQKNGDANGVFEAEYEYIRDLYRMCQRENKFL